MQSRRDFTSAFAAGAALSLLSPLAFAQPVRAKNVVLVHGLFADGSCWSEVIPRLKSAASM